MKFLGKFQKKIMEDLHVKQQLFRFKICYGKRSRWSFRLLDVYVCLDIDKISKDDINIQQTDGIIINVI